MLQSFSQLSLSNTYKSISKVLKLIRRLSKTIFWVTMALLGIFAVCILFVESYQLIKSDKSKGNYTIQDLRNNQK